MRRGLTMFGLTHIDYGFFTLRAVSESRDALKRLAESVEQGRITKPKTYEWEPQSEQWYGLGVEHLESRRLGGLWSIEPVEVI